MSPGAYRVRLAVSGPARTIGGIVVTGDRATHLGDPPPELLASDAVVVSDCAVNLWPGSFADVRSGSRMVVEREAGRWPSDKVLEATQRAIAKAPQGAA